MAYNNDVPCEGCVCIAICRLKKYSQLVIDCTLINDYFISQTSGYTYQYNVMAILNPTTWEVGDNYMIKEN